MIELGRADPHLHTYYSDGWPSPQGLVDVGERLGLQVIAVTDHDTIEGALRAAEYACGRPDAPSVVVGEEVSSLDGHVLGLFLEQRVEPGMSAAATVEAIHAQNGLAIAPHPFWRTDRQGRNGRIHGVGRAAVMLDFDAIEVENSTPGFYAYNQMARRACAAAGRCEFGGSDAHIIDAVGRACTTFPGTTADDLRQAILQCTTQAQRVPYQAIGLLRYAAWGLEHRRQRWVRVAVPRD
ncbi:MAG: PHP domain-containing protein [Candidatus Dormibacteraeota bacterium]|nr:PHP domain-containing protein [Candidatus Dormibacteraeota bacterium]